MILTKEIKEAVRAAVEKLGSNKALAEKAGLKEQNISRYLHNRVQCIYRENWNKLQPHIQEYLDKPKPASRSAHETFAFWGIVADVYEVIAPHYQEYPDTDNAEIFNAVNKMLESDTGNDPMLATFLNRWEKLNIHEKFNLIAWIDCGGEGA